MHSALELESESETKNNNMNDNDNNNMIYNDNNNNVNDNNVNGNNVNGNNMIYNDINSVFPSEKSMNPKKMAKRMRNDPKMINFLKDYQKNNSIENLNKNLTPAERLKLKLKNSLETRQSKAGQTYLKDNKKEELANKIDTIKKELDEEVSINNDKSINLSVDIKSIKQKFNKKMKKLNSHYGLISFDLYTECLQKDDAHSKNIVDLYNYQNKNVTIDELDL